MQLVNSLEVNNTSTGPMNFKDTDSTNFLMLCTLAVLAAILICVSVVGNIMIMIAIWRFKRLHSVTNYFVASLATADLIISVIVMPGSASRDLTGKWYFGHELCQLHTSLDILGCTASITGLCVISFDRYLAISNPLRYQDVMKVPLCLTLIIAAWTAAILISFVPIHMGWHALNDEIVPEDVCLMELNGSYALISSLISFYIPGTVMVSTTIRVYCIAQRQGREIKNLQRRVKYLKSPTDAGRESISSELSHEKDSRLLSRVKLCKCKLSDKIDKATITIGVILGTFMINWSPFFTVNVINPWCKNGCVSTFIYTALTWFGYINSSCNPFILYRFNRDYRFAFMRLLGKKHTNYSATYEVNDNNMCSKISFNNT